MSCRTFFSYFKHRIYPQGNRVLELQPAADVALLSGDEQAIQVALEGSVIEVSGRRMLWIFIAKFSTKRIALPLECTHCE